MHVSSTSITATIFHSTHILRKMAGAYSLLLIALSTLAFAAPQPALDARQDTTTSTESGTCSAAATISAEAACISGGGTAFVNSVCSDLTSTAIVFSTV